MDIAEYVKGISFRYLQPQAPRPTGFRALSMFLRRFGMHLEVSNTQLPEDHGPMKRRLRDVLKVPRMSTFAIGAIINKAVSQLPPGQSFVNIGVWNGFTLFAGLAGNGGQKCIGVDNFSHKNSPRKEFLERFDRFSSREHEFHERDYQDYFQNVHQGPIGFYLFDGPHLYQDQLDGLKLAEPFFAENCLVMIDDTNWEQVRRANLDFINTSLNEYRILLDETTPKSGHPTWWNGIMLFQLVGKNRLAQDASPASGKRRVA